MRGDLLYRCRLCGAVFSGRTVPHFIQAVAVIIGYLPAPADWGPSDPASLETDLHRCDDGSIGVADLQGGRPTPAEVNQ